MVAYSPWSVKLRAAPLQASNKPRTRRRFRLTPNTSVCIVIDKYREVHPRLERRWKRPNPEQFRRRTRRRRSALGEWPPGEPTAGEGPQCRHQLCQTKPIFVDFGPKTRVRVRNKPNQSQLASTGRIAGLRCHHARQTKPIFAVIGLRTAVAWENKANLGGPGGSGGCWHRERRYRTIRHEKCIDIHLTTRIGMLP